MCLYAEKTLREKVDKDGLGLDLAQQSGDLRWWHKDYRDTRAREANLAFVRNREYSPPDIMIFADSTSAREMRDFFRDREELNKWLFLPIMDKFPATADCNIELAKNEMLDDNIFEIYFCA